MSDWESQGGTRKPTLSGETDQDGESDIAMALLPSLFCLTFDLQATDTLSTGRVLKAVVQLCFDAQDWEGLNEHIVLLTKRRSQLKTVRISALFF